MERGAGNERRKKKPKDYSALLSSVKYLSFTRRFFAFLRRDAMNDAVIKVFPFIRLCH